MKNVNTGTIVKMKNGNEYIFNDDYEYFKTQFLEEFNTGSKWIICTGYTSKSLDKKNLMLNIDDVSAIEEHIY